MKTLSEQRLLEVFSNAYLTRKFEEATIDLFSKGQIEGWLHSGIGQELVGSVLCTMLEDGDYIIPYHRSKSYFLARGVNPGKLLAEIMGRKDGLCGGVGGEAHLADLSKGLLGSSGILGAGMPISLGTAFKQFYEGSNNITICSFGDGSVPQGAFHESLNFAATWNLPIVFICENNFYAELSPISKGMKQQDIGKRAAGYGIPGYIVDGYDVEAVHSHIHQAIERARNGEGPSLIECKTYRWRGHYEGDPQLYRTKEEIESWVKRDPLQTIEQCLLASVGVEEVEKLKRERDQQIQEAIIFASASPFPNEEDLLMNVYMDNSFFKGE
ncbi:thiamine pyrophosphate-dependent dehydrogenase E1 component subunit alpha [Bacillus rubiinfantis]|uniref:thiamine pyrophosphate-dependent dehydrogenase E1 component subunit alpha n=1 Tax=Bacillus rubiinfantis TaxID=1499680 RepID=UPI0005A65913|nr:thiamine pyrophosphate-dependent dehydrogenase E1 component subunit alpha [Bacillus rubiinfantis]